MKTFLFYLLLLVPMCAIALSLKLGLGAGDFVLLLALYCLVYQPTLVGLRLLDKHIITKADFAKTYIPFWNHRYFSETFF